ncbi:hypothetical protein TNCV_1959641 [Trichonephila clavipes]|nr:hypothetical protein TNCV_1959641 [Trichonephila clavipes]
MDVCKCIVPLRHGGTLNSRRDARLLVSVEHQIGMGRTGPCLEEPMVSGTVSDGTGCETILFPMRNGRDLVGCERVLFENYYINVFF